MGFTKAVVKIHSEATNGGLSRELLVDTGALYTVIGGGVLRTCGVGPKERQAFTLADGREIERDVGEVLVELEGRSKHVPVIFGEPSDPELLGVTALEIFGLEVDPTSRRLKPARLILYGMLK